MLGFVIISKKKLKDIESDAYYRGFQVARSVGYSDPTPPSYSRVEHRGPYAASSCSVTSDNAQAVNRVVQEAQAEMKQAVVKQIAIKNRTIESPGLIEPLIMQMCGDWTYRAISKHINRKYGNKVMGKNRPITINAKTVERIVKRVLCYDPKTQRFINQNKH